MRRSASVALIVGVAEIEGAKHFDPATFVEALLRDGLAIERLASTGLTSVVRELADHAARGGRATVLLTTNPEAAACLANRWPGVRAVAGRDVASVRRAIPEVAANLLARRSGGRSSRFSPITGRVLCRLAAPGPRTV